MKNYITRNIENEVLKLSESFPVVLLTGPRQVGKTTLLNHISKISSKEFNYVSLDNLENRSLAITDPKLFLEMYTPPLIIDEFQYAPNLLSYIKTIVDEKRLLEFESETSSNGLYFLTASQSFKSMKNVSESLAGRIGIIDLYGLSKREINEEEFRPFIPNIEVLRHEKDLMF